MKLNEDQKTIAKNYAIYAISFVIVFPLVKFLFGKGFNWDSVLTAVVTVLVVGILNLLLIIGAKSPKN